ncbi:MAG: response regulator, partial [Verrucomicrobiota bacterium]
KRLEAVTREKDVISRQRELTLRQLDSLTKSAASTAAQLTQAQAQIISIRQARDATQSQYRENADKLARAEDEVANLHYERELAQQAATQSAEKIAELHRQIESLATERTSLLDQITVLSHEVDAGRQKILDLSEQRSVSDTAGDDHAIALAEARQQILDSALERDAARGRVDELNAELQELRARFDRLEDEYGRTLNAKIELEEARRQLQNVPVQREAQAAREQELLHCNEEQEQQIEEFAAQLALMQSGREAVLEAIAAAELRIEEILRDRDEAENRQGDHARELESQTAELMARSAEFEQALAEAREEQQMQTDKLRDMSRQCEDHRMVAIDLAGRLDAAQRELIELTASLAEARLQVKSNKRNKTAVSSTPLLERVMEAGEEAADSIEVYPPLTEKESRSVLAAMRQCHQAFAKCPSDMSLVNELYCHVHSFAERARTSGMVALHRLGTAFASLTHHLYEIPESLTPSTMNTMQQTIEFLTTLARDRNLIRLMDPTKAQVYAVEDDAESRDIMSLGMEMVMLKPFYTAEPYEALADLTNSRFDLIFLDVDLPGMDGFELCSHIRQLPSYDKTPIIFLTGLNTPDYKAQAIEHGGNDFIGKPFNLHELGVKSLMHLLRAQIESAP